ncbi:MAG: anaerobic ribonucleoside-triphosphate reductase activating protein [Lachnospiraceae bacterium]|jgi:pyruvate formate lyase activating enzyme|nr:anaerobic ribonucleoside-triphosphate reductase activating protein [Lachnospiraceae bacterium]
MNIQGLQKTTLLDYPKHVAATIFFGGCNFRCPFCHNGNLVLSPNTTPVYGPDDVLTFLEKRKGILDGVCITGGEPTLQTELVPFLSEIKKLGLSIKLDTNGYQPQILKELCQNGLVDYVAMDIKGTPEKYAKICGLSNMDVSRIVDSAAFLLGGSVAYEFRTTVTREFHQKEDFAAIASWLAGADAYYLQSYQFSPQVISPRFSAYTIKELTSFQNLLFRTISHVEIRGTDSTESQEVG